MPKRKKTRLVDRYLPDVQAAVNVKYGPEMNALRDLLSTAQSTRDQTIAGAEAGRQGILNAMRGIAPMVQTAYHSAGLDPSPAINALGSYGSQAAQGAIGQRRQALDQYRNDVGKIQGRQAQLQSEAGDYAVSELNRLLEGARGRAVTRRGQDVSRANQAANRALRQQSQAETQRHNVAMENRPTRGSGGGGGKGGSKGLKFGTPGQQNTIVQGVKSVASLVKSDLNKPLPADTVLSDGTTVKKGTRMTTHLMRDLLASGKNPLSQKFDHDVINAGLDLAVRGGLSQPNVHALHNMGVRVRGRFRILKYKRNDPSFVGPVPR